MFYTGSYDSPIGSLMLCSDGDDLCGLWIEGQRYFGAGIPEPTVSDDDAAPFSQARAWLDAYFSGDKPSPDDLPLRPIGSDFRQAVWRILLQIPYEQVTTYGAIASQIAAQTGKTKVANLAVGGAVGHNPISIIIPCHRVVGSDGSLTGYAAGIDRKVKLLELEGVDMSRLYRPAKGTAL